MSRLFTIAFILTSLFAVGQRFTSDNRNSWKGKFGYFMPSPTHFKNPIGPAFKDEFSSPKQYVGLGLEHPRGYGQRNLCGEYGIHYFIHQTKNSGDTLKLTWFANNFYLIFKYDLLPKSKYVDVFLCVGGLVGRNELSLTIHRPRYIGISTLALFLNLNYGYKPLNGFHWALRPAFFTT